MQHRDLKMLENRIARRVVLFCFALLLAPLVLVRSAEAEMRRETLTIETQQGVRHVVEIEVAETLEEKSRGLMFRPKVPEGTGMLFAYGTPQEITMWMKNTYASLDMVFIRADGLVHRIETETEPLSERVIASDGQVTAVLELAAGAAAKLGLSSGDRVFHAAFGTKRP